MSLKNQIELIEKLGFNRKSISDQGGWHLSLAKKSVPKRGKKTSKKQTYNSIVAINKWIISGNNNKIKQNISASLDQYKFIQNLEKQLKLNLGSRAEFSVSYVEDGKFSLVVKQRRHLSLEDMRGYGNLPFGWQNPEGIFACNLEFSFSSNILSFFVTNYFCLGYIAKDLVKNLFESIITSVGVAETKKNEILKTANVHEIRVDILDLLASALKAKDSERKELIEIINEYDSDVDNTYFKVDGYDDLKISFSSYSTLDEYMWVKEIPMCVLESRKASENLREIDDTILSGELNLNKMNFAKENILMERSVLERFYLVNLLKGQLFLKESLDDLFDADSVLNLAFKIMRSTEYNQDTLEIASKLIRQFIHLFGEVDNFEFVTICFSEFFGDLWLSTDPVKSELCYQRVIDLAGDDLRIYKKLLGVYQSLEDIDKTKSTVDTLINLEPRNSEKAKFISFSAKLEIQYGSYEKFLNLTRQAYTTDRTNFQIFEELLEALIEAKKYTEFLSVVEDHLRLFQSRLSKKNIAFLLNKEALVWENGLHRPDIALKKLKEAELLDGLDLNIKLKKSEVLKKIGDSQAYLASLEECLEIAETLDDTALVNSLNEKLTLEYGAGDYLERRNLEAKKRKWQRELLDPQGVFNLIDEASDSSNLTIMYEEIIESYLSLKDDDDLFDNFAFEADKKFAHNGISVRIYESLLSKGKCSPNAFMVLREKYASNWDKRHLAKLFAVRLENVTDVFEELSITEEFFKEDLSLDDDFDDKMLKRILTQDTYDLAAPVLQKRFIAYEGKKDHKRLVGLLYLVKDSSLGYLRKRTIFKEILRSLNKLIFEGKNRIFAEFVDEIVIKSENPPELAEEMLTLFENSLSSDTKIDLCKIILEDPLHEIDLRIEYMKVLENNESLLPRYYIKAAAQEQDPNLAIGFLIRSLNTEKIDHDVIVDKLNLILEKPQVVSLSNLEAVKRLAEVVNLNSVFESFCGYWLLQDVDGAKKQEIRRALYQLWSRKWDEKTRSQWLISKINDKNWYDFARRRLFESIENFSNDVRENALAEIVDRNLFSLDELAQQFGDFAWHDELVSKFAKSKLTEIKSFELLENYVNQLGAAKTISRLGLAGDLLRKALITAKLESPSRFIALLKQISEKIGFDVFELEYNNAVLELTETNKLDYEAILNGVWDAIGEPSPISFLMTEIFVIQARKMNYSLVNCLSALNKIDIDFSSRTAGLRYFVLKSMNQDELRLDLLKRDLSKVIYSISQLDFLDLSEIEVREDFKSLQEKLDEQIAKESENLENTEDAEEFVLNREPQDALPAPAEKKESGHIVEDAWADEEEASIRLTNKEPVVTSHEHYDWRRYVKNNQMQHASIDRLMVATNSQLDKHIGLQVLSLITGDMSHLEQWPLAVWRNFYYAYYSKDVESRFPDSAISKNIVTPGAKAIVDLNTYFVRVFSRKMVQQGLANILGIGIDEIKGKRERINWNEGVLDRAGLGLFDNMFKKRKYIAYAIKGLSKKIFYDANQKSFYIDTEYYSTVPPTHLLCRILEKYWAIRLRYFTFLELNPKLEAKKALTALYDELNKSSFSILSKQSEHQKIAAEYVKSTGRDKVEGSMNALKNMSSRELISIQHNFREHLYKIVLSQTLDFIGVCESLADRNLIKSPVSSPKELLSLSRYIQPLIRFSMKMILDDEKSSVDGVA